MIIVKVEATTKSGREYVSQYAFGEEPIHNLGDPIKQMEDARQQLEYEIHQLL